MSCERAKLLRLHKRIKLNQGPYLVIELLGGKYEDALSLLIEAVSDDTLPAQITPLINEWSGNIIGKVDPLTTTVATADLLMWLESINQAAREVKTPLVSPAVLEQPSNVVIKPIQRTLAQDAAILAEVQRLNLDPLKLPKPDKGKAGVKAEIRSKLIKEYKDIFGSVRVFDDAWQRLRDAEKIEDK